MSVTQPHRRTFVICYFATRVWSFDAFDHVFCIFRCVVQPGRSQCDLSHLELNQFDTMSNADGGGIAGGNGLATMSNDVDGGGVAGGGGLETMLNADGGGVAGGGGGSSQPEAAEKAGCKLCKAAPKAPHEQYCKKDMQMMKRLQNLMAKQEGANDMRTARPTESQVMAFKAFTASPRQ